MEAKINVLSISIRLIILLILADILTRVPTFPPPPIHSELYSEANAIPTPEDKITHQVKTLNKKSDEVKEDFQPSNSSSSEPAPPTTSDVSQEESSEQTTTQDKFSDYVENETDDVTFNNPFQEVPNESLSNPPLPPNAPSDTFAVHPITFQPKESRRRVSRSKVKVRFSRNSLDRLAEITHHNFRENYNKIKSDKGTNKIDCDRTKSAKADESRLSDPWQRQKSSVKKPVASAVYGVAQRDVSLLITTPRSAEEEFEMETRKGPIGERRKLSKSVVINSKPEEKD